jgi:hypothetical protein
MEVSTVVLCLEPLGNRGPRKAYVLPEPDARQRVSIANLGAVARLLENPTPLDLQPFGELLGSQDIGGVFVWEGSTDRIQCTCSLILS